MAHIRRQRDGFRAEIYRLGVRKSRSFKTEAEAEAWAGAAEPAVVSRQLRADALRNATLRGLVPPRVLAAMSAIEFTKEQVLDAAIPCAGHCGIYFLIAGNDVIYVGKSIDVFNRIARHKRDGRQFEAFAFLPCSADKLDETESSYILAFMPWLNLALGQVPA